MAHFTFKLLFLFIILVASELTGEIVNDVADLQPNENDAEKVVEVPRGNFDDEDNFNEVWVSKDLKKGLNFVC